MMSYGLAIIVVLLLAAGFFALGITDSSSFLGHKAAGFSGVAVKGWSFTGNTGTLSVALTNQVGQKINITGVSATVDGETREFDVSSVSNELANGQTTIAISSAAFSPHDSGSGYNAKITINYTNLNSNFAASTQGILTGKFISSSTLVCAAPSASPPAGAYNASINVTLATESGSTTYYTTNGAAPTSGSAVYSGAINVPLDTNMTIKAFSAKGGYADSQVFIGAYSVSHPAPSVPNGSVVLQMNFDADTSTVAYDSSAYHNNGAIVNANHAAGISGQALNFTGAGYVSIPSNASLNLRDNLTLEAWVNWNVDPYSYYLSNTTSRGWAQIINKNGDNEWQLQHSTNNSNFEFALNVFNGTGTVRKYIQSTTSPRQGVWYHVVCTYDGQYMRLYVNGVNEKQVSMTGNMSVSSNPVNIGRRFGGGSGYNDRYFSGLIDSVAIYNRSLSAGETG